MAKQPDDHDPERKPGQEKLPDHPPAEEVFDADVEELDREPGPITKTHSPPTWSAPETEMLPEIPLARNRFAVRVRRFSPSFWWIFA